ncbi:hypothetical protein SISNIDRAFT_450679 [Sistotremastrum niveocremeum HHB9708]|uniref:Uncharacterized protein n=1 Tax=Sistotremastrum niveocremeum HHB9708 TaxID=1314777 RepID=A0A164YH85_9AGAM|nr:hypothetical protein SISNIDRAFT_450679 [Sistotremastrum niveocremeum HHB9708]
MSSRRVPSQKELEEWFEATVEKVKTESDHLENSYFAPASRRTQELAGRRPFLFVFLVIFAALSLFPVTLFLIVSAFTLFSFVALALVVALSASLVVILAGGLVLSSILTFLFCLALSLTFVSIISYFLIRLVIHLRASGWSGTQIWFSEIQSLFPRSRTIATEHDEKSALTTKGVIDGQSAPPTQ